MKTSWNDIKIAEDYVEGRMDRNTRISFESHLALNPLLSTDLRFLKKTYQLVKMYHRKKMKEELDALHKRIFSDPNKIAFRQNIFQIFKNQK